MFKKKKAADARPQSEASPKAVKAKNTKKKSGMSAVLRESVLEASLHDFQANEPFITTVDGEETYVGLLLKTSDIGGLDKKSKKDEAKGSIIECMNAGGISIYVNSELMEKEEIVIIPSAPTMTRMSEFFLLTDAPYMLCYINRDGEVTSTGVATTYKDISTLIEEDGVVEDILPMEEESLDEDNLDDSYSDSSNDDLEDADSFDDIPDIDDPGSAADTGSAQTSEPVQIEASEPASVPQDITDELTGDIGLESDEGASQPVFTAAAEETPQEDEVPGQWVTDAVSRRFYSDDLGLEATTEPFDTQFLSNSPFVLFPENRPEGWLNNQLNEMSREANIQLTHAHQNNLFLMRERYFNLVSSHCSRIVEDLSLDDERTQYGQMAAQLKQTYEDNCQNVEDRVNKKKKELNAAWQTRLREVGDTAARSAIESFKERYGSRHEQELYDLDTKVKSTIDADYESERRALNEQRRYEASRLLDLGITEVLDEISDMDAAALADERVLYDELQQNMQTFLEDNRQHDIAMNNTVAENLRQTEKADMVLAEQTAKIDALTAEYGAKKAELSAEIKRLRDENNSRIATLKDEHKDRIEKVEREKADLQAQFNDLLDKYKSIDEAKSREYEGRMNEMRDEVRGWEMRYEHLGEVHKKSGLLYNFLIVAAVVAALAFGFIGGEYINVKRDLAQEQARIMSDYQSYNTNDVTEATDAAE